MKKLIPIMFLILGIFYSCNSVAIKKEYRYTKWEVDSLGKQISRIESKSFDMYNNQIRWEQFYDENKSSIDSFSYNYDGGLIIKEARFYNGNLSTITDFTYDKHKKISVAKVFDKNGQQESETRHEYVGNSEIVKEYSGDEIATIDTILYDNKHRMISDIQYLSDGSWFQKHQYSYDSNSALVIEYLESNPDFDGIGKVELRYTNDDKCRPIKVMVIKPDDIKKYYSYEYK